MRPNSVNVPQRPLLSVARAAELLGVTESTAYRWLRQGDLPGAVRVGGRWYVRRRVLEAWMYGELEVPGKAA